MPLLHLRRAVVGGATALIAAAAPGTAASQAHSAGELPTKEAAQLLWQGAFSSQDAAASAVSNQLAPMNTNITIRVNSPGDQGAVFQTNSSSAAAVAANANTTSQSSTQSQSGTGSKGGQAQSVTQAVSASQHAAASAISNQLAPMNTNIGVYVNSPGHQGAVAQTNSSSAGAAAANANTASQSSGQDQSGGASTGGQAQSAAQAVSASQDAAASAVSNQLGSTNVQLNLGESSSSPSVISNPLTWIWLWLWNGWPAIASGPDANLPLPLNTSSTGIWGSNTGGGVDPDANVDSNVGPGEGPATWIWIWIWNWIQPTLVLPDFPGRGGPDPIPPTPPHGGGNEGDVAPSDSLVPPDSLAPATVPGTASPWPVNETPAGGSGAGRRAPEGGPRPSPDTPPVGWGSPATAGFSAVSEPTETIRGATASAGRAKASSAVLPSRSDRLFGVDSQATASAGASSAGGAAGGLLAVLTILIALATPGLGGCLKLPLAFWRPAAFVSPLDRPG